MAKQISKEVYIRNLSEEDNKMLEKLRLLTNQGSNTQALLKAGYMALKQDSQIDEYRRYIAELEGKVNNFEYHTKSMFDAQESLKGLVGG